MKTISNEIKNFLEQQKLGFVATVSPDGTPNVSPKGTILAWNENHIVFADIKSPQTMFNLQKNPFVEINVVDPFTRKGYRFKGKSEILRDNNEFLKIVADYKEKGIKNKINAVVKVEIETIREIISPLYDLGYSEKEIKEKWKKHYLSL
ncbi:MAG: pyridoxamine 5'-phosphate oxidase family protein [Nitrosopumilaceae archaeon]